MFSGSDIPSFYKNIEIRPEYDMKKLLFFIHDLGQGGAEKVLVNLVNNLDRTKFDISVIALFGGGVNEQFLKPDIHYRAVFRHTFRGNSHIMKLWPPEALHRLLIKEKYDIEVSYLEGPDARIISGCPEKDTKLVSWIHCTMKNAEDAAASFRSVKEAMACYERFDRIVGVAGTVVRNFCAALPVSTKMAVLYNTNETDQIRALAGEELELEKDRFYLVGVGKIVQAKGFDRLLRIHRRLREEGFPVHTIILGDGPEREALERFVRENGLDSSVSFPGYQTNPYKYVAKCDLFVCSSYSEGFSTAATEALIVGTPVCTTDVSGMREMLGENDEFGIVTENTEEALYQGIRCLLDDPALLAHYREMASLRGKNFDKEATVRAVEEMLESL